MEARAAEPAARGQPSRKGKKAWRKNVDISQIQAGLESLREEQLVTGGKTLNELDSTALFQTDTTGDIGIWRQARKDHGNLKATEILAQRSAISAVSMRKHRTDPLEESRKRQKISHKELQRLKALAHGGVKEQTQDAVDTDVTVMHDPWATTEHVTKPEFSYLEEAKTKVQPETIRKEPVSAVTGGRKVPSVRTPSAGKSYNPAFEDWRNLIEKESEKAVAGEKKKLAAAMQEQERLERITKAAEEADREAEKVDLSEDESEGDGIQSDYDEAQLKKKRAERKTPAERNKILRRKRAEAQARHEARMKEKEKQAKEIAAIKRGIDDKEKAKLRALQRFPGSVESSDADDADEAPLKRRYPLGKRTVPEAPLELVLGDELEDSLRRLKPEGNLLLDRYRTAVLQGKTEARRAAPMRKQRNLKPTEKWSYKDWKLTRST